MITVENLLTAAIGSPSAAAACWLKRSSGRADRGADGTLSMKVVVAPATYVMAAVAVIVVVLISEVPALSYVNRLDLARATKERAT
jgi:hypothetical protein